MFTLLGITLFWPLLLALVLVGTLVVELSGLGNAAIVAGILLLLYFAGWNVVLAIIAHPLLTVMGVVVYFCIGAAWMRFKWWDYCHKVKSGESWVQDKTNIDAILRQNKGRLLNWCGYWPMSLLNFLLADVIKKISNAIYTAMLTHLRATATRILGAPQTKG